MASHATLPTKEGERCVTTQKTAAKETKSPIETSALFFAFGGAKLRFKFFVIFLFEDDLNKM